MKDLADSLPMSPSGSTRPASSPIRRAGQTAIGVLRDWFLDHLGDGQVRALADIRHAVGAKAEAP
jgi:hypothetical protein